ncbi:MAG: NADH-quinone oxidoreductase subunit A [Blastocatellia bacterium]|nr:NADH-quinone oxidoreductase subunit A [Blastocatellia bacterium]
MLICTALSLLPKETSGEYGPIAGYVPVVLLLLIAIAFPVAALAAGRLVRRKVETPEKQIPYECGVDPISDSKDRFSVRYYMIAMLFLVFDVETIFLFPWAVIYDKLGVFGLVEILIFLGILVVGYYYAWRKGALNWV